MSNTNRNLLEFFFGILSALWEFVKMSVWLSLSYFWSIAIIQEDVTSGDKAIILTLFMCLFLYYFLPAKKAAK